MPKYRYANANGQILPSKQLKNAQLRTREVYGAKDSYDISYSFVTGTTATDPSYISTSKLTGYAAVKDSLLGWWRLIPTDFGKHLPDSSGRGNIATSPSGSARPQDIATKVTPSKFIQDDSLFFEKSGASISQLVVTASVKDRFTFGRDGNDEPFSIAGWFRTNHTASGNKTLISKSLNHVATSTEWKLMLGGDELQLWLYDASTGGIRYMGTNAYNFAAGTWYHFAVTYDGRGGTGAQSGIKIYVNGVAVATAGGTNGTAYTAMTNTNQPVTIGAALAASSQGWHGYIAEIAIWNRKLQAKDALALYGASQAGAWRLVRDFHQIAPSNDTRILGVSSQEKGFDVEGFQPFAFDATRQGVSVKTTEHLTSFTSFKLRANTNLLTTINGVDASHKWFDDTATVHMAATGSTWSRDYSVTPPAGEAAGSWSNTKAHVTIGSFGRISQRVDHMIEHRDLGQQVLYDNAEPFEDTADTFSRFPKAKITDSSATADGSFYRSIYSSSLDPTTIITTYPDAMVFPIEMVTQNGDEMTDGVIEPLTIRKVIDRTSIESPFESRTFRADLGGNIDAFRRSLVIGHGLDLDDPRSAPPFLDAIETFGGGDSVKTGPQWVYPTTGSGAPELSNKRFGIMSSVDVPGAFSHETAKITPFVDYANDYDKEYTNNGISSTIAAVLKKGDRVVSGSSGAFVWLAGSGSISLENERTHDTMASRGFRFINNSIGIDSIAFGGLKK